MIPPKALPNRGLDVFGLGLVFSFSGVGAGWEDDGVEVVGLGLELDEIANPPIRDARDAI